jgi:sterol desaturase/sphingolipid hydroxylase (fatty acid hydroxylase superfamily)
MQIPDWNSEPSVEVTPEPQLVETASLAPVGEARTGWGGLAGIPYRTALLLGALCLAVLLLFLVLHSHSVGSYGSLLESVKTSYREAVPPSWRLRFYSFVAHLGESFANPYYYLAIAAVFTLEWLFPAKKDQKILSVGLAQDLLYFAFVTMVVFYAAGPYIEFLDRFYARHLSFLTIQRVAAWPFAIRVVFGLLLNDLLHWTHHFLRHKIKSLWYFHMIHHSQREMNLFADVRSHIVETFLAITVVVVPLNMFSVTFANRGWIYFIPVLYFRLYHANIKTNLGPLRYIFVTPQSHRIHHSLEPKHWDKNYGFIFTFWDRVLGTQYKNYDEYPDTGINESDFPLEGSYRGVVKTFLAQYLYPFRRLVQRRS